MFYKKAVKVPASTTQSSPVRERIHLTAGVIHKVEIEFPAGCAGLVGARILHREFQLWPLTPGEFFVTDNFTISFPSQFHLNEEPFVLTVEAYNEDTTYDHTLSFRFAVAEPAPDPMRQIAEIIASQQETTIETTKLQTRDLTKAIHAIYNLLYQIHARDLRMIAQLLDYQRR